jgi:tetratricopeptide (TPR) repeat protein
MNLRKIQSTLNEIDALLADHEKFISAADGSDARSSLARKVDEEAKALDSAVKQFKEFPSHTGNVSDGNWEKLIEKMKSYRQAKFKLMDFDDKAKGVAPEKFVAPEKPAKEGYSGPERRSKNRVALKASVEGDSLKVNMLLMSRAVLAADGPTSIFEDIGYLYQQGKKTAAHMKLKLALRAESKELDNAIEAFKINPDAYDNLKRISMALGKYKRAAVKFFEAQRRAASRAQQLKRMKSGRPTSLWKEAAEKSPMSFDVDLASERATMASKVAAALSEIEKML